jgi:hypothetical protein
MFFRKKTKKIRHSIVKRLTPKLYETSVAYENQAQWIPRPMIQIAKEHFPKGNPLTGAEIGVGEGRNAQSVLQTLLMRKLYLIDIVRNPKISLPYEKVEWIVMPSEKAFEYISESLDFCYIDGNHTYPYVWRDLKNYFPLVKPSGLLGGHDIFLGDVKKAVTRFAYENNLKFNILTPDFWIVKTPQ